MARDAIARVRRRRFLQKVVRSGLSDWLCSALQRHDGKMPVGFDELNLECERYTRLAGHQRLRLGAP